MTFTLHLPLELEQRLTQEARRQGLPIDAYTLQLLDKHLPPQDHRAEIITLIESWIDESDTGEQGETGKYLVRVLERIVCPTASSFRRSCMT